MLMNNEKLSFNKRGGVGAKLALVLILMIASAVGGAYAYRVADGKMAVREAMKAVENVDISDYDTEEQSTIQEYIDQTTRNLETAKTRKEVYEILTQFISDVSKVKTKSEKELEEALKEAEEAREQLRNQTEQQSSENSGSDSGTGNEDSSQGSDYGSSYDDSSDSSQSGDDSGSDDSGSSFFNSLIGSLASGA